MSLRPGGVCVCVDAPPSLAMTAALRCHHTPGYGRGGASLNGGDSSSGRRPGVPSASRHQAVAGLGGTDGGGESSRVDGPGRGERGQQHKL